MRRSRASVPHELELAIRGDEADGTIGIEFAKSNALMELAIVQFDCAFGFRGGVSANYDL